jgi:hypothetical protein
MKKINLLNELIIVSNSELTQALNSDKEFGITIKGDIRYAPFDPVDIFIYQSETTSSRLLSSATPKQELLGENYEIVENGEQILIKAADAWQDIINYNVHNCHYDDTAGEGVTQFTDEDIEDMGWMIIDFDVSYAELLAMLEEKADITLVCVERENPYRFSGMGYFNDIEETRKILFDFCQNIIREKVSNDPDYALDLLDEDQHEAVEFFKAV